MLVVLVLLAILCTEPVIAQERPAVRGTIRDRESGEFVPRVLVEAARRPSHAWSDSLGAYELPLVGAGPQQVRFSRLGYESLDLEVYPPSVGGLRLDVALRPHPVALRGVRVESARGREGPPPAGGGVGPVPEIGARTFAPDDRNLATVSGEPDVLWATSASPDVVVRPDLPTALHVRGGAADQNLVLLDGMPVLSPHHSSGVLSALPPDALAEVTLHGAVPSARLGGALSAAVEIGTRDVPRQGLTSRGGVGTRGARGFVAHGFPGGQGGILVAGRRSYRPGFPGGDGEGNGFGDLLGKATVDLAGGGIDVLAFASRDRVAFAASPELDGGAADATAAAFNRFGWSSHAVGIAWRRAWPAGAYAEVRAWLSGFDAAVDWAAVVGDVQLETGRSHLGAAARVERPLAGGIASGGLSLERLRVGYDVGPPATAPFPFPDDPLLALESANAILSGFLEHAWSAGESWSFRAGVRGQAGPVGGLLAEPRLALSFAPWDDVRLSAAYGRTRQSVQSLRNEESVLDAVAGIDLPVMAGMPGVPVARSDQLTAAVSARLAAGTTLELDAYARWLDGLVLVAPTTLQPFALRHFETGSGRASGAALVLEHRQPRLTARASLALGTVIRRADGLTYHAGYERPRSFSGALNWSAGDRTRLTAAFLTSAGGLTTPVLGSFGWEPFDALGGEGELEGSPQRAAGALNGRRLPPYLRVDLGVRREWGANWLRAGAALAAHLDVLNVFDRRNVVGYALDPDTGAERPLSLLGRSLAVGLEWRY